MMCDCNTQAKDNVEKEEGQVRVKENLVGNGKEKMKMVKTVLSDILCEQITWPRIPL